MPTSTSASTKSSTAPRKGAKAGGQMDGHDSPKPAAGRERGSQAKAATKTTAVKQSPTSGRVAKPDHASSTASKGSADKGAGAKETKAASKTAAAQRVAADKAGRNGKPTAAPAVSRTPAKAAKAAPAKAPAAKAPTAKAAATKGAPAKGAAGGSAPSPAAGSASKATAAAAKQPATSQAHKPATKDHAATKERAVGREVQAGKSAKHAVAPKKSVVTTPSVQHAPAHVPAAGRTGTGLLSARKREAPARRTEGYTEERFLNHQRHALEEERATYVEQAKSLKAEAESLVEEMEPGDIQFDDESGEGGTVTVDRERDLALSAQALVAVDEIDHALAKMASNTYGICENCGRLIPKPRLEALPYARLCIDCKSGGLSRR